MDKIRPMPLDKILSLRRNPNPQQQLTESLEDMPSFLPPQLSSDMAKPREQRPPPKGRWMSASAVELPPPLRSPMSQANRQRELYSPNQYMSLLKMLLGVAAVCTLFGMILLSRLGQTLAEESNAKVILLWNEDQDKTPRRSTHTECGCVVTTRRKRKPFDAVVINVDKPYSLRGLGNINRNRDSLAVFAARKPLILAQDPLPPAGLWSLYNLTMTYRLDSQLVWSQYYFTHLNQAKRLSSFRAPSEHFADGMPGYKIEMLENQMKKKDRLALYLVYEVNEASLPESLYLVELRKYVDLFAHESCVGLDECSHYHFMLVFDPTACPDYVPPQMYVAMHKFVVPVLIGGGNLTNLVPPQSYISSSDFPKPKDLAEHLEHLMNAPAEYKRYFWWHSLYKLRRTSQPYCELCLHLQQSPREDRIETFSSPTGFVDWWTKYQCPNRSTTFL